jgi:hypothetical protein
VLMSIRLIETTIKSLIGKKTVEGGAAE